MEFSEIFSFLAILTESIKLLSRNWKFTAPIITVSLLIPSMFFELFVHFWQVWMHKNMNPSTPESDFNPILYTLKYLVPLLAVEIVFLFVCLTISHLSAIVTILISASSYTGKELSFQDLVSSVKKKWRRPMTATVHASRQSTKYFVVLAILTNYVLFAFLNPIMISITIILWIAIVVFQTYESVVTALSIVVCLVEESYQGKKALDKAGQLVQGQRVHGFMINLLLNVTFVIVFLVCWICLGVQGSVILTVYGLVFVNFASFTRIFVSVAYTVFYFWCKRHHGEEIESVVNLAYTKLPTAVVGSDVV